ncbi:MAG: hypothetical protein L3J83_07945 [Proteobacteria bacterium]|nr:hypothetical protein [Pseudomonadota bacterium]
MSFDLFVEIGDTDNTTQEKWIDALKVFGFECKFPKGFIIGQTDEPETTIECKLNPPYVDSPTDFEKFVFSLGPYKINAEQRAKMIASSDDDAIKQKLKNVKSEIHFYSSAGRSDNHVTVQCFLAATLAYSSNGVLVDPQELGILDGKNVFDVIQHSGFRVGNKTTNTQTSNTKNKQSEIQSKPFFGGSTISMVVLLLILFMAIRHFIMK